MGYLTILDGILRGGAHRLGEPFGRAQTGWLECQELPNGGFTGRRGDSEDPYYTSFALRALDLVGPQSPVFETTARGLRRSTPSPRTVIEAFSILSCARLLRRRDLVVISARRRIDEALEGQTLPDGGFSGHDSREVSAYQTFLAVLALEMIGECAPSADTVSQIASLQRASGGFAERADAPHAQTNATAAACGVLLTGNALAEIDLPSALTFLKRMQGDDGGMRAHPGAECGDLLSTFTGLLTLTMMGSPRELDLPALGRFVRGASQAGGGFGAIPGDPEADVEYTFYGIGTLALLAMLAGGSA